MGTIDARVGECNELLNLYAVCFDHPYPLEIDFDPDALTGPDDAGL